MNWNEHYRSRTISADEAAALVKPGMRVHFPLAGGSVMQRALAARAKELDGAVDLRLSSPLVDPGWLSGAMAAHFRVEFELFIGNLGRPSHDQLRSTYLPNLFSTGFKANDERPNESKPIDFTFVNVTTPNAKGFVSFGPHQWNKRMYARRARHAIAEVDATMTRTHGDVYMHVSEFEYFVDGTPPPPDLGAIERELSMMDAEKRDGIRAIIAEAGPERIWPIVQYLQRTSLTDLRVLLGIAPPPEVFKPIAGYLGELVEDGVTIQIGVGDPSSQMPRLGAFDRKHDLGLHTEMVAPGIARLVDAGVINGRRKSIHRGKAVAIAWSGSDPDDLRIIEDNPAFELYDPEYVLRLATISANYRQTSINNAISVDLTGQINSETVIGARMMNGTGGQPETHIGAFLCPGGRAITLLPSTAVSGAISRVVPQFEAGAIVTVPRYFADTVVTEYGIARLLGKNHRERAAELVAVAHPDYRGELREAAMRLFG
ncbi:MAG TPA: acetyl-CoA hydrolase/transferase C-terminal domain-containing protein [Candidatus Acidoferrales bacterium]|nr:acetyl-CoA hydrolase/transferase C-terminal domain-containing protein [Candidatus Acidoferrales bacterium]